MWVAALGGTIVSAAMVPAISVFGPELFPTSLRGRANGIVSMAAMGGSVIGLVAAGLPGRRASDRSARRSASSRSAPLLMAVVILAFFPETARRELEDINPEDATPTVSDAPSSRDATTGATPQAGVDAAAPG